MQSCAPAPPPKALRSSTHNHTGNTQTHYPGSVKVLDTVPTYTLKCKTATGRTQRLVRETRSIALCSNFWDYQQLNLGGRERCNWLEHRTYSDFPTAPSQFLPFKSQAVINSINALHLPVRWFCTISVGWFSICRIMMQWPADRSCSRDLCSATDLTLLPCEIFRLLFLMRF